MKKFFRRLKNPSPPSSASSSYTALPLVESPLVHQLTPHATPTASPFLPSSSLITADEVPELMCAACAGSQFPELLAWKPGERRPWVGLSHVLPKEEDASGEEAGGEPRCPYCAFFRALIGGGGKGDGKFAPYLRIRRAFERLGVSERHELGGEVMVEVMGRNRRLPWGYVVRAAEDEGTSIAGYLSEEPAIRGRLISEKLSVELVRLWLDYCIDHHHDPARGCLRRRSLPEGMRLIDVQQRKVVNIDNLNGIAPDYLTLSYVWGEHGRWGEALEGASLPEDIPPLISDALDFTASLGFDYIWIDRYCFLPLPEDLQRIQRRSMGDIFAQSALTLVIASGKGVADGILGLSIPRSPQLSLKNETGLYTTSLLRPDLAVGASEWQKRAWTYQEGLMARRRLVFTDRQVYFQCQTFHCHESLSLPLQHASGLNLGRVFPENGPGTGGKDIKGHIKTHMLKGVSKPEDRLRAFQGILQHFANDIEKPVDSLLGLPLFNADAFEADRVVSQTDRLAVALSWLPSASRQSDAPTNTYKLDSRYPYPSWTWLSWSLRPNYQPSFGFNLTAGEETIQNVSAPPSMEISVGFLPDAPLLRWEADGDAIRACDEEDISFLRVKTWAFAVDAMKAGDGFTVGGNVVLGLRTREAIKGWFRLAAHEHGVADGEHELLGVVISGKGWKTPGEKEVSVLVCNHEGWPARKDGDGAAGEDGPNDAEKGSEPPDGALEKPRLKRLGVLTLSCMDFTPVGDDRAVLEGVELDRGDRGDLDVRLKEFDLY